MNPKNQDTKIRNHEMWLQGKTVHRCFLKSKSTGLFCFPQTPDQRNTIYKQKIFICNINCWQSSIYSGENIKKRKGTREDTSQNLKSSGTFCS